MSRPMLNLGRLTPLARRLIQLTHPRSAGPAGDGARSPRPTASASSGSCRPWRVSPVGRTRMPATLAAPFAAAHRMADRVLRHAALVRLLAHPALAAGLAQANVHVVGVRHRAEARPASNRHPADFPARQRQLSPVAFAVGQGRAATGAAADLTAASRLHLDVVDRHAQRNLAQAAGSCRRAARPRAQT